MSLIKVSADSRTSAVAGAIAGTFREHQHAEVQAIGAGAVNQAMKALALATGYLKSEGVQICCVPEYVDVVIGDKITTAIKIVVSLRKERSSDSGDIQAGTQNKPTASGNVGVDE